MSSTATTTVKTPAAQPDARWDAVFGHLIIEEGVKFTDDPVDHGGATKFGLTLRFLASEAKINPDLMARLKIGHDGAVTVPDLRNLTRDQAGPVYREVLWIGTQICALPQPFDAAVFDQAVNDGVTPAVELLQRAINVVWQQTFNTPPLLVDGQLGPGTRTRCSAVIQPYGSGQGLLTELRKLTADRYREIAAHDSEQRKYLSGWLKRAAALGNV